MRAPDPSLPTTCALQPPRRPPPQTERVQHAHQLSKAGLGSRGLPTVCLILSPNRAPAAAALSGPKWQEASVGGTRPFIAALASWRSPLAALHRRPAQPPRRNRRESRLLTAAL